LSCHIPFDQPLIDTPFSPTYAAFLTCSPSFSYISFLCICLLIPSSFSRSLAGDLPIVSYPNFWFSHVLIAASVIQSPFPVTCTTCVLHHNFPSQHLRCRPFCQSTSSSPDVIHGLMPFVFHPAVEAFFPFPQRPYLSL